MDRPAAENGERSERILIGELTFDQATGEVWGQGQPEPARLRPRAAKLLSHLARRSGHLCSRAELQELLWGERAVDAEQGLNACVRDVRRRLGDNASDPRILETLPGRGYRLIAPVRIPTEKAPSRVRSPRLPLRLGAILVTCLTLAVLGWSLLTSARGSANGPAGKRFAGIAPAASELLREADYLAKGGRPDALSRSARLLERALDREPDWALAHAELARILLMTGDRDRARASAQHALRLDPDSAEANAAVGFFAFHDRLDWAEAKGLLERAVALDPNSTAARHAFAHVLSAEGRHDQAVEHMRVAIELDPVDARLRGDAGWVYYWARRYPESIAHARRALELAPGDPPALLCLFNALVAAGEIEAAGTIVERIAELGDLPPDFAAELRSLPARERPAAYWRYLGDAPDGRRATLAFQRLRALGQLGRRDAARGELADLASRTAPADLLFLSRDPLLDPIRDLLTAPPV